MTHEVISPVTRAILAALTAHGNQKYGTEPYGVHLQAVKDVLIRSQIREEGDPVMHMAAWLHDVLEDTAVTYSQLESKFGKEVADLVQAVTDEPGANRKERAIKTYAKIRAFGPRAVILKVADRIANTEYSQKHRSPQWKMYRREFPAFSTALYASGECDAMWDYLRGLSVADKPRC